MIFTLGSAIFEIGAIVDDELLEVGSSSSSTSGFTSRGVVVSVAGLLTWALSSSFVPGKPSMEEEVFNVPSNSVKCSPSSAQRKKWVHEVQARQLKPSAVIHVPAPPLVELRSLFGIQLWQCPIGGSEVEC